jgi:O-antigen ligase
MLMAIVWVVPAARDRMLQGIMDPQEEGEVVVDEQRMTSGRTYIWPFVLEKIDERPIVGYGMMGMRRTGLTMEHIAEQFPHPHNAYLEILLDSGYVGLVPVVLFYVVITGHALRLFVKPRTPMESAVGGVAASLILALLVAAMGSQHFYPQVGSVGMWAAIGLMLRASVRRARIQRRMEREAQRSAEREDLPAASGWVRSEALRHSRGVLIPS